MISEALEPHVDGGRVSHGGCIGVLLVMAMVGWVGAGMVVVVSIHMGENQGVYHMSGDAGATPSVSFPRESIGRDTSEFACNSPVPEAWSTEAVIHCRCKLLPYAPNTPQI